ncbi:MAG: hypothetical protein IPP17_24160 [Bacteroidetes bacterium]|nr:hypothetical protein [Bacteroidota bacterium]
MKLNVTWHRSHPMPENPTLEQRIHWHLEHAGVCGCREIPAKLIAELHRRNLTIPTPPNSAENSTDFDLGKLDASSPKVKYGFAKQLLQIALRSPEFLYPHFSRWHQMLEGENQILQWTAIDLMGRLARVDRFGKVESELPRLLSFLHSGHLITTAHAIEALGQIAKEKPALKSLILSELLAVPEDDFDSTECREIAIGKVVEMLGSFPNEVKDLPEAMVLVQRACQSTRNATAKKGGKLRNQIAKLM